MPSADLCPPLQTCSHIATVLIWIGECATFHCGCGLVLMFVCEVIGFMIDSMKETVRCTPLSFGFILMSVQPAPTDAITELEKTALRRTVTNREYHLCALLENSNIMVELACASTISTTT
jgi:hypothetical protein